MKNTFPWSENHYRFTTYWFTSPLQDAIYRAISAAYCQGRKLYDDEEELRGICRMAAPEWDQAWRKLWPRIRDRFFTADGGRLRHVEYDELLQSLGRKSRAKVKAGRLGAEMRWGRERERRAFENALDLEIGAIDALHRTRTTTAAGIVLLHAAVHGNS